MNFGTLINIFNSEKPILSLSVLLGKHTSRTKLGFRDLIALNPLTGAETNEELYQNVLDRFFGGI